MSRKSSTSMAWMIVLILFGIIALAIGTKSLLVLIPAATLIWYAAWPAPGNGRN